MPMKPGMMMVMDKISRYERYPRSEYGGDSGRRMIGYDREVNGRTPDYGMRYGGMETENRRRRDSHSGFMEGGNAYNEYEREMPYMGGYGYGNNNYNSGYGGGGYGSTEARRRRDSRGRYMMGGDPRMVDDDYDEDDMRSQTWEPPHMRGGSGSRYGFGDVYANIDATGAMNRPGMMGGNMSAPVDEHTARMWVNKMDGGEHFKPEQIEQLRHAICPECEKWEFYTAMNAMYSDYCETAKKMNMDKPEFYAHMAKDFLMDSDAKPHKLRRYMEHIAK